MGSLKFHYAPIFKATEKGGLTIKDKPCYARELSNFDVAIMLKLAEERLWAGFNLPSECQTSDEEVLKLLQEEGEGDDETEGFIEED